MIYLKIIITVILMFYFFFRIGMLINKKIKSIHITDVILYGAVLFFALFQIIGQICILLHCDFRIPLYITYLFILILLVLSYKFVGLKKSIKFVKKNVLKNIVVNKKIQVLNVVLFIFVIAIATFSAYIFNENADDGFYVSLINQSIDSKNIYENSEPSLGYGNDNQLRRYEISSYELFVSVLCKISTISSSIMCHTVLPFVFVIMSYFTYYLLIRRITKNTKFSIQTLLILSLIFVFSGMTSRTIGSSLLSKMWQGKSIFLNIVLPLVIANLIKVYYGKNIKNHIILLIITNIAGVFFTPVALFLITFSYIGFGILLLIKRKIKKVLLLGLTGIPILIYSIIMLILTRNCGTGTYNEINVFNELIRMVGDIKFVILYVVCAIITLFIGNKRMKLVSFIIPIIYLVTIYNPFFTDIIAKNLTGSNVFWRVFWLLPIEITIAYTFVSVVRYVKNKYLKGVVICIFITMIIICGEFCYTKENGYETPENLEKIPNEIIEQTNYILNDYNGERRPIVMCPPEPLQSVTMRQLTNDIVLFWSRDFYMIDIFGEEVTNEMLELYTLYFDNEIKVSKERFIELIEKYEIDYFIVSSESDKIIEYMSDINVVSKNIIGGNYIYKFN